jgi:hypothetical protein
MNLADLAKSNIPCIVSYEEDSQARSMETSYCLRVSEGTTLKTLLAQSMAFLAEQLNAEDSQVIDFATDSRKVWIRFNENTFAFSHNVFVASDIHGKFYVSVSHQKFRKQKQI